MQSAVHTVHCDVPCLCRASVARRRRRASSSRCTQVRCMDCRDPHIIISSSSVLLLCAKLCKRCSAAVPCCSKVSGTFHASGPLRQQGRRHDARGPMNVGVGVVCRQTGVRCLFVGTIHVPSGLGRRAPHRTAPLLLRASVRHIGVGSSQSNPPGAPSSHCRVLCPRLCFRFDLIRFGGAMHRRVPNVRPRPWC